MPERVRLRRFRDNGCNSVALKFILYIIQAMLGRRKPIKPEADPAGWTDRLVGNLRTPHIIFGQDLSWSAMRTIVPHVHNFFQLDYFYKGQGHVLLNRRKYAVKPGDLFIANPDDRHGFQAARERPMEGITFKFTLGEQSGRGRKNAVRFPNYVANLATLPGAQARELEGYLRRASVE